MRGRFILGVLLVELTAAPALGQVLAPPSFYPPPPPPFSPPPITPAPVPTVVQHNPRLVHVLLESLQDRNEAVRTSAADALKSLGTSALGPLLEILKGKDDLLRGAAAELLGNMGPDAEPALPTLITILSNKKENPALRAAVARTIALIVGSGPVSGIGRADSGIKQVSYTTQIHTQPANAQLEGRWARKYMVEHKNTGQVVYGDVELTIKPGRMSASITRKEKWGQDKETKVVMGADCALTKNHLLYGVFTSVRATPADLFEDQGESTLPVPFSARLRIDGQRLVLQDLKIFGVPDDDEAVRGMRGTYVKTGNTD